VTRHTQAPWPTMHIATHAGTPDTAGLRRTAILHDDGRLYLERWHILDTVDCSIRLHHWHASDDDRAPHDHPWPNATTVLSGHLIEHTADGDHALTPGTVVTRTASQPHRIDLVTDEAWTLFVTGRIVRRWGFHTADGWVAWTDWPHAGRYDEDDSPPLRQTRL
jgi:AraC-like protein